MDNKDIPDVNKNVEDLKDMLLLKNELTIKKTLNELSYVLDILINNNKRQKENLERIVNESKDAITKANLLNEVESIYEKTKKLDYMLKQIKNSIKSKQYKQNERLR
jgi:hypothetical protein